VFGKAEVLSGYRSDGQNSLPSPTTRKEWISMAVAFLQEFSGLTQEQYDQAIEKLQRGGIRGEGRIFHVAGPIEGGWRVVDVWESQDAWDKYFQQLGPILQEVGIVHPPQSKVWPVHNSLSGPENHL
jgi:hypothetical protein